MASDINNPASLAISSHWHGICSQSCQSKENKMSEKFEFKAEIKQLLNILVHSLYSHKDVFIRELISNASDALDKVRMLQLQGEKTVNDDLDLEINIKIDKDAKLISISDTGLGMTRDEIIANIGTIAHSGTGEFIKQLGEAKEEGEANVAELIGRFGVGFYSVFMAAKEVRLTTRSYKPSAKGWVWTSDGSSSYALAEAPKDTRRGTTIEITLRDDEEDFADKFRIENAIKKYSNFVNYPILVDGEKANKVSAIWREPKSSLNAEKYNEFFKFLSNREEEPLTHLHIATDMPIQFSSIMYIPKSNDEMFGYRNENYGLKLFSRRVLIQDENKDLIPEYLRFVKGVVDTEDLPLNISRETLQENAVIFKIRNVLVKKLLSHLEEMAEKESDNYTAFWREYGRIFKEGHSDFSNKDKFAELLRFNSSKQDAEADLTSLKAYVERMPEGQEEIYYLSATSRAAAESDPHLEVFRDKNVEILYLYDPIDEFTLSGLNKYKEKDLVSADQVALDKLKKLKGGEKNEEKESEKKKKPGYSSRELLKKMKDILGDRVEDVRFSERLTSSPAVLVNKEGGMSAQMEKMFNLMSENKTIPKKVLEVNAEHAILRNLAIVLEKDKDDAFISRSVEQIFETALLQDGYLQDPHSLIEHIQTTLETATELYATK
jgi:molecular chaperone HtpG